MSVENPDLPQSFGSSLPRIDARVANSDEHDELPELDEAMLARATINRGARPFCNQSAQAAVLSPTSLRE